MNPRMMSLLILIPLLLLGQNFSNGFEFYLPPDDSTSQEFLPHFPIEPIEANEFVSIDADGHFAVNNERIRFFGTNFTIAGAFPVKDKAWYIAGRLRKMGYNLVRFHHMDNGWSEHSLFERGQDTRHLNLETLDRFENMIYYLKENGIYANVNLHVSRTVNSQDGVQDADSIQSFGKGVCLFDPQFLDLHKEFAGQLLTHVNPYTGLALVNDPVMAMVEITNENSLYRMWRSDDLKHFSEGGELTRRHSQMLDQKWNDFLLTKYADTATLQQAWADGERPSGAGEQVVDGGFENDEINRNWQLEEHEGAQADMSINETDPHEGDRCARIDVTNVTGTGWHVQWKQIGLTIKKDSLYTVSFAGKADGSKSINIAIQKNSSPWTVYYNSSAQLDNEWQVFQFSFKSQETVENEVRLSFSLGNATGTYLFDDIHIYPSAINGLGEDESLEAKTVRRMDYTDAVNYTDGRVKDMSEFIAGLQNHYYDEMVAHLKSLGVKVPMNSTNWNVGPGDISVQSRLDYIDNHAYWDHPQFPNVSWDSYDWLINNTPMVLDESGGTMGGLMAGKSVVGKPYTISEYNHPFPNRYQSEGVVFLSSYAGFHDVDGFMFFDYPSSHEDWETDKVNGFFAQHRNTAMMALMPSCAYAFRNAMIRPAEETVVIDFSENDILSLPKKDNLHWTGPGIYPRKLALQHAVKSGTFDAAMDFDLESLPADPVNPFITDTDEIEWNTDGLLQVRTPKFIAATGFLNDFSNTTIGDLKLIEGDDFGTLTWVSLSDEPLVYSRRSFFTLSSRVQNDGMVWDGNKTIHTNWGGAPTEMQPLAVTVELRMKADSVAVYPLNETGAQSGAVSVYTPSSSDHFTITFDQNVDQTVWFGIEKFGVGTGVKSTTTQPIQFELMQNYPNPFNPETKISYSIANQSQVLLQVFDVRGRLVDTLVDKSLAAGQYTVEFSKDDLPSGAYVYKMSAGEFTAVRKMLLIR